MKYSIVAFLLLVSQVVLGQLVDSTSRWENVNYQRVVDMSRSYIKETHDIKIKNVLKEPTQVYFYALPAADKEKLSVVLASTQDGNKRKGLNLEEYTELTISEDLALYKIKLPYPVAPKATLDLQLSLVFVNSIRPLPLLVELPGTEQDMLWETNKLPLSIYPTLNYLMKIGGFQGSAEELAFNGVPDTKYEGHPEKEFLVYGPFDLAAEPPMEQVPLSLLYSRVTPVVHDAFMRRDVWVSHWSNLIQFEEYHEMMNKGVGLKHGFNRIDYMKKQLAQRLNPLINSIEFPIVDPDLSEFYYTDHLGNVSTSLFLKGSLLLKPRFPVFGGWHYNFTVGWTSDLGKYLHSLGSDEYTLRVPILTGPRDCVFEKLEYNVYLPAGSEFVTALSPNGIDNIQTTQAFSYLDTLKGHTKVTMEFDTLVGEMRNIEIIIKYKYSIVDQLSHVFSISIYIFVLLLSFIGIRSIDIRIKK